MSILVRPSIDKGYFRICFNGNGGYFIMLASILGTSWCHKLWQLLFLQGVLTVIGMDMAFGGGILVLQSYFTTHLGIAAGKRSGVFYPYTLRLTLLRMQRAAGILAVLGESLPVAARN